MVENNATGQFGKLLLMETGIDIKEKLLTFFRYFPYYFLIILEICDILYKFDKLYIFIIA